MLHLIKQIIPALMMVESGGDHLAIGDQGEAVGIMQIHKCVIDDVNLYYNKAFTYNDRFDPEKSKMICLMYLV